VSGTATPAVSRRRAWLLATRPRTLPAAAAGVAVGVGLAVGRGAFAPLPALACLVGALLLQIGSNVANDYFDFVRGIDTPDRRGPLRVTQAGLIPPGEVRAGLAFIILAAFAVGAYLVSVGGWPLVWVGLAAVVSLLAYSGGPFPLASHGLGDLFAFLFFGLVSVCGTYYVQAGALPPEAVAAAVPVGTLITAIIVVNNTRDIETDTRVGKRTLAVMLGPRGSRVEYLLLIAAAYGATAAFWLSGRAAAWVLLTWLSAPLAVRAVRGMRRADDGPAFNRLLAETARLALVFSLLLGLGLSLR
jgi:1,4-dihydroxy-2-naphthoate octaprenyltransferase